ncbi:MAG: hypothetical protein M1834_009269 [Cirrosporium novae-zelandiae]|nr:MAG: hypothetical protein M1834_009269 [Cirrosporium novae-zelandiae]
MSTSGRIPDTSEPRACRHRAKMDAFQGNGRKCDDCLEANYTILLKCTRCGIVMCRKCHRKAAPIHTNERRHGKRHNNPDYQPPEPPKTKQLENVLRYVKYKKGD